MGRESKVSVAGKRKMRINIRYGYAEVLLSLHVLAKHALAELFRQARDLILFAEVACLEVIFPVLTSINPSLMPVCLQYLGYLVASTCPLLYIS